VSISGPPPIIVRKAQWKFLEIWVLCMDNISKDSSAKPLPFISISRLGLCTVYRINGITDAVYGHCHCTVRVLSGFGLYTVTAQLMPYLTVFYGHI
jgi:hypothetical protein